MRVIASMAVVCVVVSACLADVVYLKNGKSYEGQAERVGNVVRIRMKLGTIEVPADEVVHIAEGAAAPEEPPAPQRQPASAPSDPASTSVGRLVVTFDISEVSMPESPGFILMRRDAPLSQVEPYRNMAHERKRRAGGKWMAPSEFIQRRGVYEKYAKEGEEYLRQAAGIYGNTGKARLERAKSLQMAHARFRMAARAWPDPLTRDFLLGVTELNAGRHAQAETFFRRCCQEAPRVAAFYQGRGMALQQLDRPLDATAALTAAARLSGSTRGEILDHLQDAMKQVKGTETDRPEFTAARDLLKDLGLDKPAAAGSTVRPSSYGSASTRWYLPTGTKSARENSLPPMDFDRLYFKQAVGLPVGPHALLVDASILEGASEVFVRIDEKTVVRAQSQRMNSTRPRQSPVALVQVPMYVFEPVETVTGEEKQAFAGYNPSPKTQPATDAAPKIAQGMKAIAYGLNVLEEMGSQMRLVDVGVKSYSAEGALEISGELAPGESAAPVLSEDGKLLCFLAARTDIRADEGGPHRVIPISEIAGQIRSGSRASGPQTFGRAKNVTTRPAPGKAFLVYTTFAEAFREGK